MDGTVRLLHSVAAATVTFSVETSPEHPSAPVLGVERHGTGVVVDEAGTILTVNYVTLGADRIVATDVDGDAHEAVLIAHDFYTGIAVVRMHDEAVTAVSPGDSRNLVPGQDVFTVASNGSEERRASSGFVSALDPFDAYWEYSLERGIWLSLINPGLGGAPVCDNTGSLVGIASLNLGAVGRSTLAIPAENYFDHADELLRHGRRVTRAPRAWVGIFCYSLPDQTVIAGLLPDGPAEQSGLAVGDIVMQVAGESVQSRTHLYEQLWRHSPGDSVDFKVLREGQVLDVPVLGQDVEEFFQT